MVCSTQSVRVYIPGHIRVRTDCVYVYTVRTYMHMYTCIYIYTNVTHACACAYAHAYVRAYTRAQSRARAQSFSDQAHRNFRAHARDLVRMRAARIPTMRTESRAHARGGFRAHAHGFGPTDVDRLFTFKLNGSTKLLNQLGSTLKFQLLFIIFGEIFSPSSISDKTLQNAVLHCCFASAASPPTAACKICACRLHGAGQPSPRKVCNAGSP